MSNNQAPNFPYAPILAESSMGMNGNVKNMYATPGWMAWDEFAANAPAVPAWYEPDMDEKSRFFTWRAAYADTMLQVRAQRFGS
jgi:hypothetical protein